MEGEGGGRGWKEKEKEEEVKKMLKLDRYPVLSEVCSGAWMGAGWSRCQSNPSHPNNQTSHATLGGGVRGYFS